MRRRLAYALGIVLTMTGSARAVIDMTGTWATCGDCRIGGVCDPFYSPSPTTFDTWTVTQSGAVLTVQSSAFGYTFNGTIDSATGAFSWDPPPANLVGVDAVATFATFAGMYDSTLETGSIVGARSCNPMAPACDDGTSCTDDACVSTTIGTCTDDPPVNVCVNTQNGTCSTTTTTSTTISTTTSLLPADQHPVTGSRLILKKSSSGRETLIFVSKDPAVYVPAFGAADDPTLGYTHIDLYTPNASSPSLDIPAGVGKPGWLTKPAPPTYQFKNSFAPNGISVVRSVKLRAGKGLKIVARATGLSMTQPLGAVGILWTLPSPFGQYNTICAHFGAASVNKDVPPIFIARTSPAPLNCIVGMLREP
jgi:hypothetical protein